MFESETLNQNRLLIFFLFFLCSVQAGVAECGNEDGYSTCLKSNELECITSILIPSAPDLELRLSLPSTTTGCQSVCTLDKVRFSLERLKKNSQLKAPSSSISSPTSTSTTTTTSTKHEMMMKKKRTRYFTDSSSSEDETVVVHTVISGDESLFCCSLCSSYVFVTEPNSRCPRCESSMPFPMPKKSKIEIVTGDEDILDQEGRLFGGAQFPRE